MLPSFCVCRILIISYSFTDDEKCKGVENFGSYMCFTFAIPADIDHNDVDAAELWVYRQSDPHANEAQSFLVSEIESWDSKKINKPLAIHYANSSGMNNSALAVLHITISLYYIYVYI